MVEENKVEQTTEADVSRETNAQQKQEEVKAPETTNANTFTEEDVNNIVKQRLAKERASKFR